MAVDPFGLRALLTQPGRSFLVCRTCEVQRLWNRGSAHWDAFFRRKKRTAFDGDFR